MRPIPAENTVLVGALFLVLASLVPTTATSEPNEIDSQHIRRLRPAAIDTYIYRTVENGYAAGRGTEVGTSCSTDDRRVSFVPSVDGDYMDVVTTKWHSGGYRMDCRDKGAHTGWSCWATCGPFPNPNFGDWSHLTFEAKLVNAESLAAGCGPTLDVKKRWPPVHSNAIPLGGHYVDGGDLVAGEFRRVVIPIADLATDDWPTVDGVKDVYFRSCGTSAGANPHYRIRSMMLTSDPPSIGAAPESPSPTESPSPNPTTAAPTGSPSKAPTAAPTDARWPVFETVDDAYAIDLASTGASSASTSCFVQRDRLGITTATDPLSHGSRDYFTIPTDPWVGGGFRLGCVRKERWTCVESCGGAPFDGSDPDWSTKTYLTFEAKIQLDQGDGSCKPRMSLTGGGWPRQSSRTIALEDTYVDAGSLAADEWRRVAIPLEDFKTDAWDLTSMHGIYFHTCGTSHRGAQPVYLVSHLAVTDREVELLSHPPSSSPTPYATDDFSEATHRWVHTNWYPILGADREPDGRSWIVASDDAWPVIDSSSSSSSPPGSVTVLIPKDTEVIYDGGADSMVYDKIVVEGSLTIRPTDADVSLTVGSIVVEGGGVLDIETIPGANSHTIEINIYGSLDRTTDPEEQLLGIVSLEGNLTIAGNPVSSKMASLSETVAAGSDVLFLDGTHDFAVGGELVLPDTQEGLDVGHWNFLNSGVYVDQTESCIIDFIEGVATIEEETTVVTCRSPFAFDHAIGSTAAYATRSITIKTARGSTDRGHILHTGLGKFDVSHARIQDLGRTTTEVIDSTVMAPDEDAKFPRYDGTTYAKMIVTELGSNQIARYALHAHHSLVESRFEGNALLHSPRDGCVAHNSRVHILENIVVGADGTGIFLEDATETGPVANNYVIGTGGGTRVGDDARFSTSGGGDMAHGGFGIWSRGKLAPIRNNRCEGHFGIAPYAFFVHPNFLNTKRVPDVPGTSPSLVGRLLRDIPVPAGGPLQLQTHGGFVNNTAVGTFKVGIGLSYFSSDDDDITGSILQGATIVSLAASGCGISTTHSRIFTLDGITIEGVVEDNDITGIWCNNCNGCTLETPNTTLVVDRVGTVRGGNC